MEITEEIIERIEIARKKKGLSQTALAQLIGAKAYTVNKLIKGRLQTIKKAQVDLLNDALDIELEPFNTPAGEVSEVALALTGLARDDRRVARLLEMLLDVIEHPPLPTGESQAAKDGAIFAKKALAETLDARTSSTQA